MLRSRGKSPSWLYSFVDLAFLLLVALSQLDIQLTETLDLGEIPVPEIVTSAAARLASDDRERWQLSVHPPESEEVGPFELGPIGATADAVRIDFEQLRVQLATLQQRDARKPLLAPHQQSVSRDLLAAVALLEESWPSGRRAVISPIDPDADSEIVNLAPVSATR